MALLDMIKKKLLTLFPQFPKIYRFITEKVVGARRELRLLAIGSMFGALIILILLSGTYLAVSLRTKSQMERQKQTIVSQISYWQKVVKKQEGYRDGYFMLAVLEYQIKNFSKSKEYLRKAMIIDPNFVPGLEFEKVLNRPPALTELQRGE